MVAQESVALAASNNSERLVHSATHHVASEQVVAAIQILQRIHRLRIPDLESLRAASRRQPRLGEEEPERTIGVNCSVESPFSPRTHA